MNKQVAVIGLGAFGKIVLEELIDSECEIIVIDKDQGVVEPNYERTARTAAPAPGR